MKNAGIIFMITAGIIIVLCLIAMFIDSLFDDCGCIGKLIKICISPFTLGASYIIKIAIAVLLVGLGLTIYGTVA